MPVLSKQRLTASIKQLAVACGASDDEAQIFADCHVRADLRGHQTQGLQIVNIVHEFLVNGTERFGVDTPVIIDEPGFAVMDGNYGVGCIVATRAMDHAIRKAGDNGIACVWVRRGGVFSMASNYTLRALEHDMVGIATENGVPFVAPWGGRDPLFSTNPFSFAVPSGEEIPIVVDMSAGSFSAGKVMSAKRAGEKMPSSHLVDGDGNYTDDPSLIEMQPDHQVTLGALVAHGARGFGWSVFVEILAGLLSGMEASCNSIVEAEEGDIKINHGQFFMAINVEQLMPVAVFKRKVDDFIRSVRANPPAKGFDTVRLPGENAAKTEQRYLKDGIPVTDEDWDDFLAICSTHGLTI